ncbi:MAG TPA: SdrD B-like domain-containing protein, partial [Rhodothermales bacterium]|nr:SdrD B-like domain-containing protein [Rhodothermales bacterium]
FIKRHAGLGPLGTDGIYLIDYSTSTPTVSNYIDLGALGFSAGNDPHTGLPANKIDANSDTGAFDAVGKVGLGDIDLSEDGSKLYVMNLFTRSLLKVNIGSPAKAGSAVTVSDISSYPVPNPACTGGDYRPFATKVYRGKVYIGIVCNAQSSQNASNLRALVYEFDESTNSFNTTPVFTSGLNFNRGVAVTTYSANWRPWITTFPNINDTFVIAYPQPILSDIEFDVDGAMILGFTDRFGHQSGRANINPVTNQLFSGGQAGDMYRAAKSGSTWVLENNGTSGSFSSSGAGNGQGPGGGEFFWGDDQYDHDQQFEGGLAVRPGSGEIVSVSEDPINGSYWAGGVIYSRNNTGAFVRGNVLYKDSNDVSGFGKAVGLGDVELLCSPAPLEIGNRVWLDSDSDGIQDADEGGISGVTVRLFKSGSQVATTTTNTRGEYYFNNGNVTGGLLPNMAYEIRLDKTQTAVTSYSLSNANAGTNDAIDSDATMSGNNAVIALMTGGYGVTNHTYDFGFNAGPPPPDGWSYVCSDDKNVGLYGRGVNGATLPQTISIPNSGAVFQVVAEVVYKGSNPGATT